MYVCCDAIKIFEGTLSLRVSYVSRARGSSSSLATPAYFFSLPWTIEFFLSHQRSIKLNIFYRNLTIKKKKRSIAKKN